MAQFGDLAPFGLLAFGSDPSPAEPIYNGLLNGSRAAFDVTPGTHYEASLYARAVSLATVRATTRHAFSQRRPLFAVEMLPALERKYDVAPLPTDSLETRRRTVAALQVATYGSRPEAIITALQNLLGSAFTYLRKMKESEIVTWPATLGTLGVFPDPKTVSPTFLLASNVATTGTPVTFQYKRAGKDDGIRLLAGQTVTMQIENSGLAENVTITSVADTSATATFTHSHDALASILTYAPACVSNRRRVIVGVTPAAARVPTTLAKVYGLLARIVRGVTDFNVYETTGTTAGPFFAGTSANGSRIAITPIGDVAFSMV